MPVARATTRAMSSDVTRSLSNPKNELRNSHALGALEEGALEVLITQCVAQAARGLQAEVGRRRRARRAPDAQFDLFTVLSPALERECERATGLIRRLCALERTRPAFTVEAICCLIGPGSLCPSASVRWSAGVSTWLNLNKASSC